MCGDVIRALDRCVRRRGCEWNLASVARPEAARKAPRRPAVPARVAELSIFRAPAAPAAAAKAGRLLVSLLFRASSDTGCASS